MIKKILLLTALLPFSLFAAEIEVKINRIEASDLYVALAGADAGLAPASAIAAADNINVLRPIVEALDKGKVAYQKAMQKLSKSPPADLDVIVERLNTELEGKALESFTLKLSPITLTEEEVKEAKLKPATLATIRRWLLPAK